MDLEKASRRQSIKNFLFSFIVSRVSAIYVHNRFSSHRTVLQCGSNNNHGIVDDFG